MITLLLLSGGVIGVVLYRSIAPLLRQIPNGNGGFNAFLPESEMDSIA